MTEVWNLHLWNLCGLPFVVISKDRLLTATSTAPVTSWSVTFAIIEIMLNSVKLEGVWK